MDSEPILLVAAVCTADVSKPLTSPLAKTKRRSRGSLPSAEQTVGNILLQAALRESGSTSSQHDMTLVRAVLQGNMEQSMINLPALDIDTQFRRLPSLADVYPTAIEQQQQHDSMQADSEHSSMTESSSQSLYSGRFAARAKSDSTCSLIVSDNDDTNDLPAVTATRRPPPTRRARRSSTGGRHPIVIGCRRLSVA